MRARHIKLRVPSNLYYILGEKVEVSQPRNPADPPTTTTSVWLPATVADAHDENRYYTVLYDGGDRIDIRVPSHRLRRGVADALKARVALRVDDQVEANFSSEGNWHVVVVVVVVVVVTLAHAGRIAWLLVVVVVVVVVGGGGGDSSGSGVVVVVQGRHACMPGL